MSNKTENNNTNNAGIGFAGALTLLFVALKLTDVIDWPWIWVLAPMWISILFVVFILVTVLTVVWKKGGFK